MESPRLYSKNQIQKYKIFLNNLLKDHIERLKAKIESCGEMTLRQRSALDKYQGRPSSTYRDLPTGRDNNSKKYKETRQASKKLMRTIQDSISTLSNLPGKHSDNL